MTNPFDPYHRWLGIPPEKQPPHHYALLAIEPFENDSDVIAEAADRQMAHLRTHQAGIHSRHCQKLMNEVSAARICLLSPQKKAAYDEMLRVQMQLDANLADGRELSGSQVGFRQPVDAHQRKPPVQANSGEQSPASGQRTLVIGSVLGVGLLSGIALVILGLSSAGGPKDKPKEVAATDGSQQQSGPPPQPPKESPNPTPAPTQPRSPVAERIIKQPAPSDQFTGPELGPEPSHVAATVPVVPVADHSPGDDEPRWPKPVTQTSKKTPVPAASKQKEMLRQFEEVYHFSQRRTPQERVKLANELFALAQGSVGKPVEKFVAMRKAIEMAGDGGDANLMLKIVDAMSADFDIPLLEAKQKVLADFVSGRPQSKQIQAFLEAANPVIDEAIDAGREDIALNIAEAAFQLSRRAGDTASRKRAYDRRNEVRELAEQSKEFHAARAVLKKTPDDPAANLAVGKYYCFDRGDWPQGLAHLAKGSDSGLKSVAEADLAGTSELPELVRLGDRWWDLAALPANSDLRDALRSRAGHWYRRAAPRLSGLQKVRVQKRIDQSPAIAGHRHVGPADSGHRTEPTGEGKVVDLLGLIDVKRGAVRGNWHLGAGALVSPKEKGACLQIPFSPPDEYDLEVVARREAGNDSLSLGLVAAGRQFQLQIDGWPNANSGVTGIELVDGKQASENETTRRTKVFTGNEPVTVLVSVREGRITVTCGGRVVVNWNGDQQRLALPERARTPNKECLFLATFDTVYRFSKMQLTPISGTGTLVDLSPTVASTELDTARWVLGMGGKMKVSVDGRPDLEIRATAELPGSPLWIKDIGFNENNGRLDVKQLDKLAGLTHLESLDLRGVRLVKSELAWLRSLTNLKVLWLANTPVTDAGLAHVGAMSSVDRLHLQGTRVSDKGLAQLAELTNLIELRLERTGITDAGLAQLKPFRRLHWLGLSETSITDAGLARLAELPDLQMLHLDRTAVTDAGLAHLGRLPKLRVITLNDTQVTDEGIRKLQRALPKCKIDH